MSYLFKLPEIKSWLNEITTTNTKLSKSKLSIRLGIKIPGNGYDSKYYKNKEEW